MIIVLELGDYTKSYWTDWTVHCKMEKFKAYELYLKIEKEK